MHVFYIPDTDIYSSYEVAHQNTPTYPLLPTSRTVHVCAAFNKPGFIPEAASKLQVSSLAEGIVNAPDINPTLSACYLPAER